MSGTAPSERPAATGRGPLGPQRAIVLAVAIAAVLLHWPWTQAADFTYDDADFVVANASIRSVAAAVDALGAPFPPEQRERGLYRPIANLSYALDYAASGLDARAFHRTNALLYGGVVLAGASLFLATLPSAAVALAATALFAFHPVHSEAVDSIAGRSELLALLFSLLALRAFEAALRPRKADEAPSSRESVAAFATAALYALGCASKETAVVLPGVLAFRLLVCGGPHALAARGVRLLAPSFVVLVGYLALRLHVLGGFTPGFRIFDGEALATRIFTMGHVYWEYFRLLVWPGVLQLDFYYQLELGFAYGPTATSLAGWALGLATVAAFAIGVARHLNSPNEASGLAAQNRCATLTHAAIALAFFFPISHVLGFGALLAERFLFAPSFGVAALVALGGDALLRSRVPASARRAVAIGLVAVLSLVGSARGLARSVEWRDGVALWESFVQLVPGDPRAYVNLGKQHLERENHVQAETAFTRALDLEAEMPAALMNLAVLREREGRDEEALETYRRLLDAHPSDALAWNNRGAIEARQDRWRMASRSFEQALVHNPNDANAKDNLELMQELTNDAREELRRERARAEETRDPELVRRLGAICQGLEDPCALHYERLLRQIEADRSGASIR